MHRKGKHKANKATIELEFLQCNVLLFRPWLSHTYYIIRYKRPRLSLVESHIQMMTIANNMN